MTFALLGLAAIQFRYVKNTLVLKEAQFHYTVDMALSQVGQELQRHEAKQLMQRNQQGRNALERLDSIQHVLSTGWSQDKGYYVKDTVVITEDGALKMSYTTYQDQGPSRLTGGGFADLESDVMVMYNDEWLEEFITGMFDPGLLDPRQQGMEFTELDSIVSSTFAQLGIDSEVQLAVFNSYNEPLLFDNAQGLDPLVALSKADHRMRLPGNVFGIDTEFLHVRFPDKDTFIMSSVWPMLLTSGSLMLIIMGAFGLTIYAILRQKRSSEIKNDFISNMTHELKTPVSTIALACEALEDPDMRSVKGSSDRYIGMIKEENKRLGALVENVLQTAIVDKGELRLKMEGIRLHELIKHSVDTVQLALEKRAGTISLDFQALDDQIDAFKEVLLKNPAVKSVTNSASIPGRNFSNNAIFKEGESTANTYLVWQSWVNYEFAETYSLELVEGRFFSIEMASDSSAIVLNESAIKSLGMENPIGKRLMHPAGPGSYEYKTIIGVLKDFNFQSLHKKIEPMGLNLIPGNWEGYIPVKLNESSSSGTIDFMKRTWEDFNQDYPFDYFWMEDDFMEQYETEIRTSKILTIFSLLSLFIASLGLFGLISFTAEKRTREIGIRKSLGATVSEVLILLSKETVYLVGIAALISLPFYFVIKNWLQNFAYHFTFNLSVFLLWYLITILIILIIALITVSFVTFGAARRNPADSLRYE